LYDQKEKIFIIYEKERIARESVNTPPTHKAPKKAELANISIFPLMA